MITENIKARFWSKVNINPNGCWLWTGSVVRHGYGQMWSGTNGKPPLRSNRVSWEIHFGPIPKGMFVCHRCDNGGCVRPDHLFLGTQKDNMADASRKGRLSCPGGRYHKLTPEQVAEIRRLYVPYKFGQGPLSKMFGVGPRQINYVVTRSHWRHV